MILSGGQVSLVELVCTAHLPHPLTARDVNCYIDKIFVSRQTQSTKTADNVNGRVQGARKLSDASTRGTAA